MDKCDMLGDISTLINRKDYQIIIPSLHYVQAIVSHNSININKTSNIYINISIISKEVENETILKVLANSTKKELNICNNSNMNNNIFDDIFIKAWKDLNPSRDTMLLYDINDRTYANKFTKKINKNDSKICIKKMDQADEMLLILNNIKYQIEDIKTINKILINLNVKKKKYLWHSYMYNSNNSGTNNNNRDNNMQISNSIFQKLHKMISQTHQEIDINISELDFFPMEISSTHSSINTSTSVSLLLDEYEKYLYYLNLWAQYEKKENDRTMLICNASILTVSNSSNYNMRIKYIGEVAYYNIIHFQQNKNAGGEDSKDDSDKCKRKDMSDIFMDNNFSEQLLVKVNEELVVANQHFKDVASLEVILLKNEDIVAENKVKSITLHSGLEYQFIAFIIDRLLRYQLDLSKQVLYEPYIFNMFSQDVSTSTSTATYNIIHFIRATQINFTNFQNKVFKMISCISTSECSDVKKFIQEYADTDGSNEIILKAWQELLFDLISPIKLSINEKMEYSNIMDSSSEIYQYRILDKIKSSTNIATDEFNGNIIEMENESMLSPTSTSDINTSTTTNIEEQVYIHDNIDFDEEVNDEITSKQSKICTSDSIGDPNRSSTSNVDDGNTQFLNETVIVDADELINNYMVKLYNVTIPIIKELTKYEILKESDTIIDIKHERCYVEIKRINYILQKEISDNNNPDVSRHIENIYILQLLYFLSFAVLLREELESGGLLYAYHLILLWDNNLQVQTLWNKAIDDERIRCSALYESMKHQLEDDIEEMDTDAKLSSLIETLYKNRKLEGKYIVVLTEDPAHIDLVQKLLMEEQITCTTLKSEHVGDNFVYVMVDSGKLIISSSKYLYHHSSFPWNKVGLLIWYDKIPTDRPNETIVQHISNKNIKTFHLQYKIRDSRINEWESYKNTVRDELQNTFVIIKTSLINEFEELVQELEEMNIKVLSREIYASVELDIETAILIKNIQLDKLTDNAIKVLAIEIAKEMLILSLQFPKIYLWIYQQHQNVSSYALSRMDVNKCYMDYMLKSFTTIIDDNKKEKDALEYEIIVFDDKESIVKSLVKEKVLSNKRNIKISFSDELTNEEEFFTSYPTISKYKAQSILHDIKTKKLSIGEYIRLEPKHNRLDTKMKALFENNWLNDVSTSTITTSNGNQLHHPYIENTSNEIKSSYVPYNVITKRKLEEENMKSHNPYESELSQSYDMHTLKRRKTKYEDVIQPNINDDTSLNQIYQMNDDTNSIYTPDRLNESRIMNDNISYPTSIPNNRRINAFNTATSNTMHTQTFKQTPYSHSYQHSPTQTQLYSNSDQSYDMLSNLDHYKFNAEKGNINYPHTITSANTNITRIPSISPASSVKESFDKHVSSVNRHHGVTPTLSLSKQKGKNQTTILFNKH